MNDEFSKQARDLVNENQRLKVKSAKDDEIKAMLKEQYDALAAQVTWNARGLCRGQLQRPNTERDKGG